MQTYLSYLLLHPWCLTQVIINIQINNREKRFLRVKNLKWNPHFIYFLATKFKRHSTSFYLFVHQCPVYLYMIGASENEHEKWLKSKKH